MQPELYPRQTAIAELSKNSELFLVVVPITFNNSDERSFWQKSDCAHLLNSLLQEVVEADKTAQVVAVVEEGVHVHTPLRDMMQMITVPAQNQPRTKNHPFDSAALRLVLSDPRFAGFNYVVHVNFRHILLQRATLSTALNLFRKTQPPVLLSLTPTRDHPCQFQSYFRILDQGLIHFFEGPSFSSPNVPPKANYRITRTFPFDWARYTSEDTEKHRLFQMDHDAAVCLPSENVDPEANSVLWVREAKHLARVLIHTQRLGFQNPSEQIFGIFHSSLSQTTAPRLVYSTQGNVSIHFSSVTDIERTTVLLAPFGDEQSNAQHFRLHPHKDGRIKLQFAQAHAHGLIFTHLAPVITGAFDLIQTYAPTNAPWRLHKDCSLLDVTTGTRIRGRQDFPPVHTQEDAIAVFSRKQLNALPAIISSGQAKGFLMEHGAVHIHTRQDAAQAAIRLQTMLVTRKNSTLRQSFENTYTNT